MRVGSTVSRDFTLSNAGTNGPLLTGAINNLGIDSAALSGSGVTAQNWYLANGESRAFTVNYTPLVGGVLTGQSLAFVNNFDNVAGQTLAITGAAFGLAAASAISPATVVLANQRVGSAPQMQSLVVSNTAVNNGYSESLMASIAGGNGVVASGSFNALAAGATSSNNLRVGVDTSTAGAKAGTATVTLSSNGAGSSGLGSIGIGTQQVAVSGNVYRLAAPQLNTTSVSMVGRVGDSVSAGISVTNQSPDLFTENLNASVVTNLGSAFTPVGSLGGLTAGASSSALTLGLDTSKSGSFSTVAQVNFVSSGAGTTNAADVGVGSGAYVAASGRVYAPAVAQVASTVVDFGIVRVGSSVGPRNVVVTNAAGGDLNDTLGATLTGGTAPFTTTGAFSGLAAGANSGSLLQVGLSTTTAGVFNGNATLAAISHNDDMADLALGSSNITLKAQVNNLAQASFSSSSGAFSATGGSYLLDFGSVLLGSGAKSASLVLKNSASGLADALGGSFDLSSIALGDLFTVTGFGGFSGLAAGDSLTGFNVSFASGLVGTFDRVIVLNALSTNGSGPDLALNSISLRLHGEVGTVAAVPEPGSMLLMVGGLVLLVGAWRRRSAEAVATA